MVETRGLAPPLVATGTPPIPARSRRLLSWDILRVLGVFAVLAFHATFLAPKTDDKYPGINEPPFEMDFPFGASLLLTVSGYFAAMTVGKHTAFGWWLRRLARLVPAFVAAVVLIFGFTRMFGKGLGFPELSYYDLWNNLLLLHVLRPSVQYVDWPHWTVPVQVAAFTGIFLLAAFKVKGRSADIAMWLVLVVPLLVRWFVMDGSHPAWVGMIMDGTGVNRIHLFVAGVAIYRWSQRKTSFTQLYLLLVAVLLAHSSHPPPGDSVLWYALALALICVAAQGPDWDHKVFLRLERPIRWLGANSYGIYLMHFTIGTIIARRLTDLGLDWWAWIPVFFAVSILNGWLLTKFVEKPAFKLLSRRLP